MKISSFFLEKEEEEEEEELHLKKLRAKKNNYLQVEFLGL